MVSQATERQGFYPRKRFWERLRRLPILRQGRRQGESKNDTMLQLPDQAHGVVLYWYSTEPDRRSQRQPGDLPRRSPGGSAMTRPRAPLLPEPGISDELHVLEEIWTRLPVEARAEILTLAAMRLAALPRPPKQLLKQIALVMP